MDGIMEVQKRNRLIGGFMFILVGSLVFARKLGVLFPDWLFTWPMFLIALGVYVGAKHNFKNPSWAAMVLIGSVFMLERVFPDFRIHEFFWPILLIAIGVFVIIKPNKPKHHFRDGNEGAYKSSYDYCGETETNENKIEITAIMGGVKRIVISKEFQGGEINCVMGGAEINLTQADIQGRVVLEVNNILGGTKLIIPANWEVISEAMVVLGGIEDKRPLIADSQRTPEKILVIKGACVFGGIDIRSY